MDNNKLHTYLIATYGIMLVVGAMLFLFDIPYSEGIFAAGAVLAIIQTFLYAMQHKEEKTGDIKVDIQQARLHRLQFVASLFLGIAAWLMFMDNTSWIAPVMIYVVITLYLSFRVK